MLASALHSVIPQRRGSRATGNDCFRQQRSLKRYASCVCSRLSAAWVLAAARGCLNEARGVLTVAWLVCLASVVPQGSAWLTGPTSIKAGDPHTTLLRGRLIRSSRVHLAVLLLCATGPGRSSMSAKTAVLKPNKFQEPTTGKPSSRQLSASAQMKAPCPIHKIYKNHTRERTSFSNALLVELKHSTGTFLNPSHSIRPDLFQASAPMSCSCEFKLCMTLWSASPSSFGCAGAAVAWNGTEHWRSWKCLLSHAIAPSECFVCVTVRC